MQHRWLVTSFHVLLIAVVLALPVGAANLLVNGDFEIIPAAGEPLLGWPEAFNRASVWGQSIYITSDAYEGNGALLINDTSDKSSYGWRSDLVPAHPGHQYRVLGTVTNGGGIYLEFKDSKGVNITTKSVKTTVGRDWTDLQLSYTAPEKTAYITVMLYSFIPNTGIAMFDNVQLYDMTLNPEALITDDGELEAEDTQLDYRPAEGALVTTNPASFVWIPIAGVSNYEVQVSTSPDFAAEATKSYQKIDISIYTPAEVMDTAPTYYWRVRGITPSGVELPWSDARSFRYDRNAAQMPLPALETVRARIPAGHPRLFVRPETLQEFRDLPNKELLFKVIFNSNHVTAISNSIATAMPVEPVHCSPNGTRIIELWSQGSSQGGTIMRAIEAMAFDYLLTGDPEMGKAVRNWMLTVASWDPKGATSAAINDEISMPILYTMSRAYTWAYDALSPEDREIIRENIRIRGTESYKILKARPFESRPYASHAGRQLGFLGEAAIAFMGEIPEAAEWFDYIVRIYYAVYPAWGSDPGGWAEGQAYWTSYINRVMWFCDALVVATDLNLYDKPFFKNNGYFKLYTQPPYSLQGPFGDHATDPPSSTGASIMSHYAGLYNNPYFKWWAMQKGGVGSINPMLYVQSYLASSTEVEVKAPSDLPQSRYFADIGWVAMHRDLANQKENIQFMFKSSPYGSISHSMADQNSFTIEAFGEVLALSSGYRPWYGSPHHDKWTRQTKAQNSILIDGKGQPIKSISAKGEIRHFLHGSSFDYTVGDAIQAYTNADRFLRHVVYVRPNMFVMFDDVAARNKAVKYDWLLHTYTEMQIDEANSTITVPGKQAYLTVKFHTPQAFSWSQTDKFETPLDKPMNKPIQWHLTATTTTPAAEQVFLTTLIPRKTADTSPGPQAEQVSVENGYGVKVVDEAITATVLFRKETVNAALQSTGIVANALVAAVQNDPSGVAGLLMVEGTNLSVAGVTWLSSAIPVQTEVTFTATGVKGSVVTAAQTELLIKVGAGVTSLVMDGQTTPLATRMVDGQRMAVLSLPVPGTYEFSFI